MISMLFQKKSKPWVLEKEPQEGTEDIIVNFIRPKYTQGILVELIQQVGDINYDATFTSRWGEK